MFDFGRNKTQLSFGGEQLHGPGQIFFSQLIMSFFFSCRQARLEREAAEAAAAAAAAERKRKRASMINQKNRHKKNPWK